MADGSAQRPFVDKKDAVSPTASNDGFFVTLAVDVQEQRDAASPDMPNAFVQTRVPESEDGTHIIMRITRDEVDMFVKVDAEHENYVACKRAKYGKHQEQGIYAAVHRAIYGMVQSATWFHKA